MNDVLRAVRRALALVGKKSAHRVYLLAFANAATALLDMVGLVLLVPLLALLGAGAGAQSEPGGQVVHFAEKILGTSDQTRVVLLLALAATVVFVLKGAASVVLLWLQASVLNRAELTLSQRIVKDYVNAPWLVQQGFSTGTLIQTAIGAAANSTLTILGAAISIIGDGAVFIAVFAAIVLIDPYLAIGAIAYLGIVGLVYLRVIRRTIESRGRAVQAQGQLMNSSLIELSGGMKEMTVRGTADVYADRFVEANRRYLDSFRLINVSTQGMRYALEALLIGGAGIIIVVASLTSTLAAAVVSIGVMLAGGIRLLPALNTLLVSVNQIRSNTGALAYVDTGLRTFASAPRLSESVGIGSSPVPRLSGAFSFNSVTFTYPTRHAPALTDISIEVRFGEALGIVGSTGSGKSTFVDLLLGLIAPDEGEVAADGFRVTDVLDTWRHSIGFVPQDIFLVDDTLTANIALGVPDSADSAARLTRALELAQLSDVVSKLPDGLDTVLGERGVRLSGGQRQRVGLARALYEQPSVLILDEATSALDNDTERRISDALNALHGTLTTVVVAHRLSTVRACDRILYLEGGRIAGLGTFDELDRTNEGFARLVELGSLRGSF